MEDHAAEFDRNLVAAGKAMSDARDNDAKRAILLAYGHDITGDATPDMIRARFTGALMFVAGNLARGYERQMHELEQLRKNAEADRAEIEALRLERDQRSETCPGGC